MFIHLKTTIHIINYLYYKIATIKAHNQAIKHCQNTTPIAHDVLNSRLIDVIAAIQGEYNKLKTSKLAAALVVITVVISPAKSTSKVDTTLSLAINPLINEVTIRQSPKPKGLKIGTKKPEIHANMLEEESSTKLNCKSKLCKNQTKIVAIKITEKAF